MIGQPPSFPPFLSLFILRSLHIVNKLSNRYLLFTRDNDLFQAVKPVSNHGGGKHIFTSLQCRRQTEGGVRSQAHWASESPPACMWELFWWNICLRRCVLWLLFNSLCPPSDVLLLLYTALISPRLTSRHARELPADSSVCVLNKITSNFQNYGCFLSCVFMFREDESRSFVRRRGMQIHANTAGLEGAEATLFTNDNKSVLLLIEYSTNDLLRGHMTFVSVSVCL